MLPVLLTNAGFIGYCIALADTYLDNAQFGYDLRLIENRLPVGIDKDDGQVRRCERLSVGDCCRQATAKPQLQMAKSRK